MKHAFPLPAFCTVICSSRMAQYRVICFVCLVTLSIARVDKVLAEPPQSQQIDTVKQLEQVFGKPEDFVANFNANTKDKADEIIGFMVAAFGFNLVVRSLIG